MIVKLLTEHHLEFLSLKGGCTGSSESTHVKMPHCWKSHVIAQLFFLYISGEVILLINSIENKSSKVTPIQGSLFAPFCSAADKKVF